ncbi:MAG: hypothetical protein ACU84Q_21080, partial [Gammaproteobacteria bacterium]
TSASRQLQPMEAIGFINMTIWVKSNDDPGSLTDEEMVQMLAVVQRHFRVWEEAYALHNHGRLDDETWESINRQYTSFLNHRGFNYVWKLRRDYYNENFRQFVDALPSGNYVIRKN